MLEKKSNFLKGVKVKTIDDALKNAIISSFQRNPTYKSGTESNERKFLRNSLRDMLRQIGQNYVKTVSEKDHIKNIKKISYKLSKQYQSILQNKRFRIGTSQKALNLYLKFLWCLEKKRATPPHCPVDAEILKSVKVKESWTKLDSVSKYKRLIERISIHSKNCGFSSIAEWELNEWNIKGIKIE